MMTDFDETFYDELDAAHESILELALESEGHTIDPKVRESLPDSCFGIVEEVDGKTKRSYPLVVPGNKQATDALISKAVQFFHYAKEDRRKPLAQAIIRAIRENRVSIEISEASQILRYVNKSDLPKTITIVPRKAKKK